MGVIMQFIGAGAASIGAFCLGTILGWSGPMEPQIVSKGFYPFSVDSDQFGWISSLLGLGAACSCIPIGFLCSLIGRKLVMLLVAIPFIIGGVLICIANNVWMLYIGRFLVGACGAAYCVAAPMYIAEISQVSNRGILGCFFQLFLVFGILFVFVIAAFGTATVLNYACAILPAVFILIFIWMPESPVYQVQKGKKDKAEKTMSWLRGKDHDIGPEVNAMVADAAKEKPPIGSALSRKVTLKGLMISVLLMFFQQMTGINAILFYMTGIFEKAATSVSPDMCTFLIGIVQVVSVIIALLLIDRLGRKMLLLVSSLIMGITTFVMGIYFLSLSTKNIGWLPILTIGLFLMGFSVGFGPIPWVILAEVFSEDVKPLCAAITGTSSWLFAFFVTKLFPIVREAFGPEITFWIFTLFAIIAFLFILCVVPETKGKTLDEIQTELGG